MATDASGALEGVKVLDCGTYIAGTTCGTEEPDEGKLHVRICGAIVEQSPILPGQTKTS